MSNPTPAQMLAIARQGRPGVEYRLNIGHNCIAALKDGVWCRVAALLIADGRWCEMGDLLINGQRMPFFPDMDF